MGERIRWRWEPGRTVAVVVLLAAAMARAEDGPVGHQPSVVPPGRTGDHGPVWCQTQQSRAVAAPASLLAQSCQQCHLTAGDNAGSTMPYNAPLPTLGGRQFWGDVRFFSGWRVQQNVLTKHFRLLDPGDIRRAWGTREECDAALAEIRRTRGLPPMAGKACLLIHGIGRSSKSMAPLAEPLRREGYLVVPFDYPSTRLSIEESADYLRQVVRSLEGVDQIDFVVHSMGGLLVRSSLAKTEDAPEPDPRYRRLVMLGVPNHGARMADLVERQPLYRLIYGRAGGQLVGRENPFITELPIPAFEFAVIAGARGTGDGYNPLIPGDDDGTVRVEETRLPGATDFMTVPAIHSFLMNNPAVIDASLRFLKEGQLRSEPGRTPIPQGP